MVSSIKLTLMLFGNISVNIWISYMSKFWKELCVKSKGF